MQTAPSDPCTALHAVHRRIDAAAAASGRDPSAIGLLAVSKTRPAAAVRALAACGQRAFGESYLQEALDKIAALGDLDLEWHFIGPIQSNKTRGIAGHFQWVHGIDRPRVAERLSAQRPRALGPLNCCIQVDTSGEASKAGVPPGSAAELARLVAGLPGLRLRGLMTIPAPATEPEAQREPLRALRALYQDLRRRGLALDTLSMGMSADLEAAVLEGATLVRVGTALFGPRAPRRG